MILGTQSRLHGFSTMSRRPHRGKAQLPASKTVKITGDPSAERGLQNDSLKESTDIVNKPV